MLENRFFGIILTVLALEIGKWINSKVKNPLVNPLLIAILLIIGFLKLTGISYDTYKIGGDFIVFFIGPATVAMILDLYKHLDLLKSNLLPVFLGIILGSIFTLVLTIFITKVVGFDRDIMVSLLPQSVTTAIAISLSEEYAGVVALTAIVVVIRGITGAVVAPTVLKVFRIEDPVAQGVAIGTSSHAVGTSEARKLGKIQGGFSGLSVAVAGIVTALLMPFAMILLNFLS
ncbi:MAG: LrgB family protein [Anaerococcus sp.]